MKKYAMALRRIAPTIPPTTPPIIAPVLVLLVGLEVFGGDVELVVLKVWMAKTDPRVELSKVGSRGLWVRCVSFDALGVHMIVTYLLE